MSQPSDGPVLQPCVTAQFYLESKGKYILKAWGWADPEDTKRTEAPIFLGFFLLYICLLRDEPALCKLGWLGGVFISSEVLTPVLGPLFYCHGLFPFFVF